MAKTIFISIYAGDTERDVLRSGIFEHLKTSGARIVLLIRGADRLEYYRQHFVSEQVAVELLPRASSHAEALWYYIGWNSLPTRAAEIRRHMYLSKGWPRSRYLFGRVLGFFGRFRLWREFLRLVYRFTPDSYARELFDTYKPDVLFAPGMFSPEDSRLLRQAKRLGIKTVTTAKSWDVLTTKAFTRVKADRLVVFNQFNKDEAIALGDYEADRVVVCGFPQFDMYTHEEMFMPREEFIRSIGGDPAKRMVMIAVPGDWKTPFTQDIMQELDRRIEEGRFGPLQVLARFHPKYPDSSEKLKLKHFIFDRPGTQLSDKKEFSIDMGVSGAYSWTFTDRDLVRLANSLKWCDVVINTESTMTLDAACLDTPTILIGYDGDAHPAHWDQIARIYEREHYRHVVDTGAAPLVKSHDELEVEIKHFLADKDYRRAPREELKRNMLYKIDGKAAERVAHCVLELVQ